MIIGALLIMITVMWFGFRDYVIYGVCRLLYWDLRCTAGRHYAR